VAKFIEEKRPDKNPSESKRLVCDMPKWAVEMIDLEAARRGVARQALVKMWLIDILDELKKEAR
jgi:hypothetical protein